MLGELHDAFLLFLFLLQLQRKSDLNVAVEFTVIHKKVTEGELSQFKSRLRQVNKHVLYKESISLRGVLIQIKDKMIIIMCIFNARADTVSIVLQVFS